MALPILDSRGLLPPGIHVSSFYEVEQRFLFNPYRISLYWRVRGFIDDELARTIPGRPLIMGGSFFSDKDRPADIELAVQFSLQEYTSIPGIRELAESFDATEHERIMSTYSADFYVSPTLPGFNDFSRFFQYVGPKTATDKGLQPDDKRGVIEVIL